MLNVMLTNSRYRGIVICHINTATGIVSQMAGRGNVKHLNLRDIRGIGFSIFLVFMGKLA